MADAPPEATPAPPAGPPILQRPTYVDPAPGQASEALRGAGRACRDLVGRQEAGLWTATLVGVTAAYFAPKVFDWALAKLRERQAPAEYDLEVEE